jgi:hypothetical protein
VHVLAPATWTNCPLECPQHLGEPGPQNRVTPLADPERHRAAAASRDGVKPSEISRDLVTACIVHRSNQCGRYQRTQGFHSREFAPTECFGSRDQTNHASCGRSGAYGVSLPKTVALLQMPP